MIQYNIIIDILKIPIHSAFQEMFILEWNHMCLSWLLCFVLVSIIHALAT
jgi:hypothetical protein